MIVSALLIIEPALLEGERRASAAGGSLPRAPPARRKRCGASRVLVLSVSSYESVTTDCDLLSFWLSRSSAAAGDAPPAALTDEMRPNGGLPIRQRAWGMAGLGENFLQQAESGLSPFTRHSGWAGGISIATDQVHRPGASYAKSDLTYKSKRDLSSVSMGGGPPAFISGNA